MNKSEKVIGKILKIVFKPKEKLTCAEFMERHVKLSSLTTGISGDYSFKFTPYLKGLCESIDDPKIKKIVITKSVQSGVTTWAMGVILYYIATKNLPIAYFSATKDLCKTFSERSLEPSINLCDPIQKFRLKHDCDSETVLTYKFSNCILKLAGANNPTTLASFAAALVIADEASKFPQSRKGEAPNLMLAEARAASFAHDKKFIVFSTPIEENQCQTTAEFLKGDQCEYFVKSPYCDQYFLPTIDMLKHEAEKQSDGNYLMADIEKTTYLECPFTRKKIKEHQKIEMVQNGKWIPQNTKNDPSVKSYRISAITSMQVLWSDILKLYVQSKHDLSIRKYIYTNMLGQSWKEIAHSIKSTHIDEVIKLSKPDYYKGELPINPICLYGAGDTQKQSFYYSLFALAPDLKAYLIDWGNVATILDLEVILNKKFVAPNGESFECCKFLIDQQGGTGHNESLNQMALTYFNRFILCRGLNNKSGLFAPFRESKTIYMGTNLPFIHVNDEYFKSLVLIQYLKNKKMILNFPQDLDQEYIAQITAEQLVERKNIRGQKEYVWKAKKDNHYSDVAIYAECLRHMMLPYLQNDDEEETTEPEDPNAPPFEPNNDPDIPY